jgi:hypothetical protein
MIGDMARQHRSDHLAGDQAGALILRRGQQHGKFLAAIACHHIRLARDRGGERLGDLAQAAVARQMALPVVQHLEVVDIHHQQRQPAPRPLRYLQMGAQRPVEAATISHAGQLIEQRDLPSGAWAALRSCWARI